tara:strand:- start:217 stop:867 length:651 start_codon:yes stop_codon:yes gene_type:complete
MKYLLGLLLVANYTPNHQVSSQGFVKPIQNKISAAVTYDELHDQALFNCPYAKMTEEKERIISQLVEIEKSFKPPPEMRGMLLAAACMESGYNPVAKGDHKFSKSKKKPMAIGILQMWPIYEKMFPGLDRTNPEQAANGWMKHIVKQIPKVKRMCKYKTDGKIWLAAWVTGIRSKKVGGRCKERPLHYRLLRKWHRNIKKDRKAAADCKGKDGCGC